MPFSKLAAVEDNINSRTEWCTLSVISCQNIVQLEMRLSIYCVIIRNHSSKNCGYEA